MKKYILLFFLTQISVFIFAQKETIDIPKYNPQNNISNETAKNDDDYSKIYTVVDQSAEFPGGISAFRGMISNNFDTTNIKDSGVLKTIVRFIVEKDGTLSEIKAEGNSDSLNREAERTILIISAKRWNPAKINGEPVRSRFNIPLSMNFE